MEACKQHSLIESGLLSRGSSEEIDSLMNYLQVTIGDRVLIYNLNEKNATLVNYMDETIQMTDP